MSEFSTRLINKSSHTLPQPPPKGYPVFEPQLASQIKNVFRFKVKGIVSPFKRHMSVFLLRMTNNS